MRLDDLRQRVDGGTAGSSRAGAVVRHDATVDADVGRPLTASSQAEDALERAPSSWSRRVVRSKAVPVQSSTTGCCGRPARSRPLKHSPAFPGLPGFGSRVVAAAAIAGVARSAAGTAFPGCGRRCGRSVAAAAPCSRRLRDTLEDGLALSLWRVGGVELQARSGCHAPSPAILDAVGRHRGGHDLKVIAGLRGPSSARPRHRHGATRWPPAGARTLGECRIWCRGYRRSYRPC